MTDEELARLARLVVQNVIRLENIARDIARQTTPAIKQIYQDLISQIQALPTGSVEREMAYQLLEDLNRTVFRVPTIELASELKARMSAEAVNQIKWAANYVQLNAGLIEPGAMAQMAVAAVDDVQVLNQAVEDITGPLTRSQWKRIDKTIRTGFLTGATNEELARAVARTYKANLTERRAIARTAVMSLAQEAHNQFWDANADVIVAWRWDASMDYRVCPVCAPLDGVEHAKRSEFADMPPIHPNCRCHVVPVTEAMRATEKEDGEGDRNAVELVPADQLGKRKGDVPRRSGESPRDYLKRQRQARMDAPDDLGARYYMKTEKINGRSFYRRAVTYPEQKGNALTMGGFLKTTNRETLLSVLDSPQRAFEFERLVLRDDGPKIDPDRALLQVVNMNLRKGWRAPSNWRHSLGKRES